MKLSLQIFTCKLFNLVRQYWRGSWARLDQYPSPHLVVQLPVPYFPRGSGVSVPCHAEIATYISGSSWATSVAEQVHRATSPREEITFCRLANGTIIDDNRAWPPYWDQFVNDQQLFCRKMMIKAVSKTRHPRFSIPRFFFLFFFIWSITTLGIFLDLYSPSWCLGAFICHLCIAVLNNSYR